MHRPSSTKRVLVLSSTGAVAIGAVIAAVAISDRSTHPATVVVPRASRPALPVSWLDRADRTPPPPGYIPAWRVRPPRPFTDPPPDPVRPPVTSSDAAHAVDGDRPSRPIPGLGAGVAQGVP